jgi:hypothetical protein
MSDVPYKIWAKPSSDGWLHGFCSDVLCDDEGAEYLLSTPAREHADELVEAVEMACQLSETGDVDWDDIEGWEALLTKIKEASNE